MRKVALQDKESSNNAMPFFRDDDTITISGSRKIVSCSPETTVHKAAALMSDRRVGSILICDPEERPVGIMTDTDFRRKIVAQRISIDTPIGEVMSKPVFTIPQGMPVAQVVLTMMKKNIRHLCITHDGTPSTPAIGLISEHDVLLQYGNNPAILVKEMTQATSVSELAKIRDRADKLIEQYLQQQISIPFLWGVVTSLNDAVISRCIILAQQQLQNTEGTHSHNVPFCWLAVGSEGRSEQILRTDQDNALVYATPPTGMEAEVKTYFRRLAMLVNDMLEQCGFEKCPGEVMASNPKWCTSISEWQHYFMAWIRTPEPKEIMHCGIFFDFRPVFGDFTLADTLRSTIADALQQEKRFLTLLAKNALQNPAPLSFFRNFIVEKGGEHKNEFDIKLRAIMPLVEAARVLAFDAGMFFPVNTNDRLEFLAKEGSEVCRGAATAFRLLSRFRAHYGYKNNNSGRYISPQAFDKVEREVLRNTFSAIDDLQKVVTQRFQLDILR
jgi:CBS domain-containing protein